MIRFTMAAAACFVLVSCGAGRVSGEIGNACMNGGRSAANSALCSCVQRAANQTLRGSDQARAAEFFADPHLAQETRQSNRSTDEAFWARYRNFANTAESMCRA